MPQPPAAKDDLTKLGSRLDGIIQHQTRGLIAHFNQSQATQTEWIKGEVDKVHVEPEAIKELLAWRQELQNLVREIKSHGLALDESKIFNT
ncbi:MAG: hypothetical protein HYY50_02025 [Candidatus Kerfeldbacteria bacterium]|nr:hypothetical protein [Candidatus Kerfeldbacteria bacterium]